MNYPKLLINDPIFKETQIEKVWKKERDKIFIIYLCKKQEL